jgi:hypothetical protein
MPAGSGFNYCKKASPLRLLKQGRLYSLVDVFRKISKSLIGKFRTGLEPCVLGGELTDPLGTRPLPMGIDVFCISSESVNYLDFSSASIIKPSFL